MKTNWAEELRIKPGDHIIAIITTEDDLALLPPYIVDGWHKGDLCSVVALPSVADRLRGRLRDAGIDVQQREQDNRLYIHDPRALGDRDGHFSVEAFVTRLQDFIEASEKSGVSHIRNMASMSWVKDIATELDGIHLCARLNDVFKDKPISGF